MSNGSTWEYKFVNNPTEDVATVLGRAGWELVAVTAISPTAYATAYFKRQVTKEK